MSTFSPPGRLERSPSTHPLFGRLSIMRGTSLLKQSGIYLQVDGPSAEEITAAEIAYLGGYVYTVTENEAVALAAAGYGGWLIIGKYGAGVYGAGTYGGI